MIPFHFPGRFRWLVFLLGGFLLMASPSCMKKENYPVVPEIAYQGFTLEYDSGMYATRGFLTFSFKDGDGDIGLSEDMIQPPYDTGSIYYYNLFIDYYEKQDGRFVKVDLNPTLNARLPYLTPDDPNKSISGFISDTLPLNPMPVHDTIMVKFRICDRALHLSNTDSTPVIILKKR